MNKEYLSTNNIPKNSEYEDSINNELSAERTNYMENPRFLSSSWNIINCNSWSSSNSTICSKWTLGYKISDDGTSCQKLETVETLSTIVIATTLIGIFLIGITTMLKITSPYSAFLTISQYQVIIALTMIGGFRCKKFHVHEINTN